MHSRDPETKRRQAIGEFPRRQAKGGIQDTNGAGKQEEIKETQEVGHKPPQEAEPVDSVVVQEEEEVVPALPYRADSVVNIEVVHTTLQTAVLGTSPLTIYVKRLAKKGDIY